MMCRTSVESMISSHYGKTIMLLFIITVILQAYHMTKLKKLQKRKKEDMETGEKLQKKQISNVDTEDELTDQRIIKRNDLLQYIEKLDDAHEIDSSGIYMIVPNVVIPESDDVNDTLSLISQTTANHLHYLKDLTEAWHGRVSITVFTYGHDAVLTLYSIALMHTCFETVQTSVRFHIAYPISHPPVNLKTVMNMEMHCDNFEYLMKDNKINYDNEIPYPLNVLRNIAIKYSLTKYILVIDIDMIPSEDLDENFKKFISRQSGSGTKGDKDKGEQIVYVVPAFESRSDRKTFDKKSLLNEWDLQNVRQFYRYVCLKCQVGTDYKKWRGLANSPFLDIGYILEWPDSWEWEPFYIARKEDLPLYDERFKQYGFNRISQVCELYVAGYQFAVLNSAFVVHKGFKNPKRFHTKKAVDIDSNWKLFQAFKEDLKEHYPESTRHC